MSYRGYRRPRSRVPKIAGIAVGVALAGAAVVGVAVLLVSGGGSGRAPSPPAGSTLVLVAPTERTGSWSPSRARFPVSQESGALPPARVPETWEVWNVDRASPNLALSWIGGCSDGYVIYVDERPAEVDVDIWERPAELSGDEVCAAVGVPMATRAALTAPLGDRELRTHVVRP